VWRITWIGEADDQPHRRAGERPVVISRQKLVGWILIVVSAAYIAYFVRVRLFTPGPILEKKEWVQFIGSIVILMVGTINVRMAAMRERKRRGLPN
jgi:hypothetical protein